MRRAVIAAAGVVLVVAGCGGKSAPGPAGGASVAPASSAFLLRLRARTAQDWRVLEQLFPREAAAVDRLRGGLGPETDVLGLDEQTLVALTQPPDRAKLDSLLAEQRPRLVSEEVGDWLVVARSRRTIDRLKQARNGGSLADSDTYRKATGDLSPAALATFYAAGLAVGDTRERRAGPEPVPGLGRVGWEAGTLSRRAGGLDVELRVNGDRIEATQFTAELPAQIPAPVTLLVDAKGLDRTIEELKGSPALATSKNPFVQALRTGVLDDAVALFKNEAAFYVRPLPGAPEYTLIVNVDDQAAADAVVDRLVTLIGAVTQKAATHETIAGVDATRLVLGKTTVYYAVFDRKLVATTVPSGIRGLRRTGRRVVETGAWRSAGAAAKLPDRTAGLAYADVQRALPLVARLFGMKTYSRVPALGHGLVFASVDGSVLTVRGFVALR